MSDKRVVCPHCAVTNTLPAERLGEQRGSTHSTVADPSLALGGPAAGRDALAREVDHGVDALEGGGVDAWSSASP